MTGIKPFLTLVPKTLGKMSMSRHKTVSKTSQSSFIIIYIGLEPTVAKRCLGDFLPLAST